MTEESEWVGWGEFQMLNVILPLSLYTIYNTFAFELVPGYLGK